MLRRIRRVRVRVRPRHLLLLVGLVTLGTWIATDDLLRARIHLLLGHPEQARDLALAARVMDPRTRNRVLTPALLAILQDRSRAAGERYWAGRQLGMYDPDPAVVREALLAEVLHPGNPALVRGWAARTLGKLGPEAASAVPELVPLLDQLALERSAPDLWYGLCGSLRAIGPPARASRRTLLRLLLDPPAGRARPDKLALSIALTVGSIDHLEGASVPELIAVLRSGDRQQQDRALLVLTQLGPGAREAAPEVMRLLEAREASIYAHHAAESIGCIPAECLPRWVARLDDEEHLESTLIRLLQGGIHLPETAIPRLLKIHDHPPRGEEDLGEYALRLVARIDQDHPGLWPRLEGWLLAPPGDDRLEAGIETLHEMEQPPEAAIPYLLEGLDGQLPQYVREYAVEALSRIDPPPTTAIDALLDFLGGENDPRVADGVPLLLVQLAPEDPRLPPLFTRLAASEGEDHWIRVACVRALGRLGPAARDAVPVLRELLLQENLRLHLHAAAALGRITGRTRPYLELLLVPFERTSTRVRPMAAEALGEMGPLAGAALPLLRRVVGDRDTHRDLREAAERAIRAIDR